MKQQLESIEFVINVSATLIIMDISNYEKTATRMYSFSYSKHSFPCLVISLRWQAMLIVQDLEFVYSMKSVPPPCHIFYLFNDVHPCRFCNA
jgi:hypothetical protein